MARRCRVPTAVGPPHEDHVMPVNRPLGSLPLKTIELGPDQPFWFGAHWLCRPRTTVALTY
jgi:hypothetical protein